MKKKYLLILLALLSMVILIPGCVYFNLGPTNAPSPTITPSPINSDFTPPPTTNEQTPPEIPDFVSVVTSVRPSVVAINTMIPGLDVFGGVFSEQGAGSGWIIDSSGLIVTNNHVVEGASSITVTLEDGRNFSATLVRTDAVSDLAVIKINADNLQAAKVGDSSKMRVGDWVLAIGNSLGQGISVTKGIISATGVSVSVQAGETQYDLIQTDAAINPGNSGGSAG